MKSTKAVEKNDTIKISKTCITGHRRVITSMYITQLQSRLVPWLHTGNMMTNRDHGQAFISRGKNFCEIPRKIVQELEHVCVTVLWLKSSMANSPARGTGGLLLESPLPQGPHWLTACFLPCLGRGQDINRHIDSWWCRGKWQGEPFKNNLPHISVGQPRKKCKADSTGKKGWDYLPTPVHGPTGF